MLEWDEIKFALDCKQWGILNFTVKTCLLKGLFKNYFWACIWKLIWYSTASLGYSSSLFISWMGITWLDSLTVAVLASMLQSCWEEEITSVHEEDEGHVKAAQPLASGLVCPGLRGHHLVKDLIAWSKNRSSLHRIIVSQGVLSSIWRP